MLQALCYSIVLIIDILYPPAPSCPDGFAKVTCSGARGITATWNDSLPFTANRFIAENITRYGVSLCIPPNKGKTNGSLITCNFYNAQDEIDREDLPILFPEVAITTSEVITSEDHTSEDAQTTQPEYTAETALTGEIKAQLSTANLAAVISVPTIIVFLLVVVVITVSVIMSVKYRKRKKGSYDVNNV